jgi:hypothetical protein
MIARYSKIPGYATDLNVYFVSFYGKTKMLKFILHFSRNRFFDFDGSVLPDFSAVLNVRKLSLS